MNATTTAPDQDNDNAPRVALVAGAGRGIGYATCRQLADAGWDIAAGARSVDELDRLKQELADTDATISCHGYDIGDATAVNEMVKTVMTTHGRIDAMVNSAGTSYVAPVALANIEKASAVIQTNLMGAFILSRAVLRPMTR